MRCPTVRCPTAALGLAWALALACAGPLSRENHGTFGAGPPHGTEPPSNDTATGAVWGRGRGRHRGRRLRRGDAQRERHLAALPRCRRVGGVAGGRAAAGAVRAVAGAGRPRGGGSARPAPAGGRQPLPLPGGAGLGLRRGAAAGRVPAAHRGRVPRCPRGAGRRRGVSCRGVRRGERALPQGGHGVLLRRGAAGGQGARVAAAALRRRPALARPPLLPARPLLPPLRTRRRRPRRAPPRPARLLPALPRQRPRAPRELVPGRRERPLQPAALRRLRLGRRRPRLRLPRRALLAPGLAPGRVAPLAAGARVAGALGARGRRLLLGEQDVPDPGLAGLHLRVGAGLPARAGLPAGAARGAGRAPRRRRLHLPALRQALRARREQPAAGGAGGDAAARGAGAAAGAAGAGRRALHRARALPLPRAALLPLRQRGRAGGRCRPRPPQRQHRLLPLRALSAPSPEPPKP